MKKTIIGLSIVLMLLSAFCVSATAADDGISTPSVSSLSISSYPDRTVYGAFEQLDVTGLALRAVFTDGSEKIIEGREIRVSYNRDNCFRVGDDSVLLSYGGKSLYLPVTVNRIAYDISALELDNFSTVYNGAFQGYSQPIPQIVGLDGIPLKVSMSGGGTNVGIYDISVDFATDSRDYLTPESRVIGMTVEPAEAQIVWEGTSFVYDGRSKSPLAYYTDVNGARVYLTVSGASTNAGTGYVARATTNDLNYEFSNTTIAYEIKKADIDISGAIWSKDRFTYDGSKKSISASGLPSGVSIIGYSGDRATDAGIYTVTAMLEWDSNNYNAPQPLTHTWEIKKADYDMTGISFRNESFTYDGKMHYPTLIGNMPVGADGIILDYSFSSGACHVADGKVAVKISFHTASKNYNIPAERYSSVVIMPLGISVDWGETSIYYNGERQAPGAFAEECAVKVSGASVNAGRYIATATTDNSDYFIVNDRAEYTIMKAENYWTVTPADSVCYEGRRIALIGEAKFGEIAITFFADSEGMEEISAPIALGKYYAILTVSETENYSGISSEIISFEIVEVLPVSFLAEILRSDIRAFDSLTPNDYRCRVINNDGSISEVDSKLVSVVYENGNSFLKRDEWVRLEYGEFVLTLPVGVEYANYDISGVKWTGATQTYDGSAKLPKLEGLPKGVKVVEYVGGEQVNAGSYKIYARLEYDEDNYNEPQIPYCDFLIKKCPVNAPLITSVYNGRGQIPESGDSLYTVSEDKKYTDAGLYSVLVTLTDPANYCFKENSDDSIYAVFQIIPATLSVNVSNVKLRLFEELTQVDYVITGGTVYNGDIITVTPYAKDRQIFIRSDNPNYTFDISAGRLIRLPYPTARGAALIMTLLLLVIALVFALLTALRNRHRIVSGIAMLKCRWHNRGYKAPMPRPMEENVVSECDIGIAESFDMEIESYVDNSISLESDEEIKDTSIIDESENIAIIDFEIDAERADSLITDSLAKSLINREGEIIYTAGSEKEIINVDVLSKNFSAGDRVDVNSLKKKGLVSTDTAYIKILGRGSIDKPLMVYANDFSLSAVKMIALTGGQVTKVVTFKERSKDEKD